MAELELIQDRVLSGKGVLKIPSDVKKLRYAVLFCDVVRRPKNEYLNFAYNPPRGRYGTLVFLRQGYVVDVRPIEYPQESFDTTADISGQTLIAVKCMYAGILQTFINLGLALSLPPISVTNTIEGYENLRLTWDEIRFVAYADTAIQMRLYRKPYDVCNPDYDDQDEPPPPPPPPVKYPPGTPIEVSPPYDEDTSDDDNTEPYPDDSLPPPPIPECTKVRVTTRYNVVGYGFQTLAVNVYAPVEDIFIQTYLVGSDTNYRVVLVCRGNAGGLCAPNPVNFQVDASINEITSPSIVSIEELPP